ncbi:LuxR C-terminal-related transcriptional regulator [Halopseudomonas pelagia]|uniref:HTH luxR-type domain-containing protein n=1 Tax=Halopseudomonas pelagia TaxID=553151 RepID=A0AA91Z846_9GAMM|nr:LuxR C-terminal-related transcriptional regulator [Halopseudomonas pelagia]PCD01432.1 hypothetical protein CO192_00265 [Halopseudomonas pelagia]QFY55011.1 hypothetical protein EAO82_00665 [Halopseudomonas pelagia]
MSNDARTKTMISPLLRTKLVPPRQGRGTLPRPRLEQLIERVAETTLTVIKAPPGFGKSTLASAWAEAAVVRGARVAWLSLDEADNTSERLLRYVAAAVERGFEGDDEAELPKDLSLIPAGHLSTLLLNALARRREQCFLFIDDYHCVPEPVLTEALEQLIRFAPDNLHLVLCGRTNLPACLFAHIYCHACLEVNTDQLRFDVEETRDLLLRTGVPILDASDVLDLHAATEGWITALRASLINHPQRRADNPRLTKSISGVFDELINRLTPELSAQLPHLAAVKKFNAPLVERLIDGAEGRTFIAELERLQLFITGLDETGEWFSLHPLFCEHLQRRLSPQDIIAALRRAAWWFADQSAWTDAVRCALAAGDNDSAQEWIAYCAMGMVERGDFAILLDWQRQLRDRLLRPSVALRLALAWAAGLAMSCTEAREQLESVRSESTQIENSELYWECQALEGMILSMEDHSEAGGRLAQASLQHLERSPWIYNTLLNVVCFSHLHANNWEAFYSVPPVLYPPSDSHRCLFNKVYRLCVVGLGEHVQGRLSQAAATYKEGLRLANDEAWGHPVLRALPSSFLATVRYQQGDLVEAGRLNLKSTELIKLGGSLDCVVSTIITASRLSSHNAAEQRARHYLDEGERLAHSRDWPRLSAELLLERTRISLLENKQHEALACARKLEALNAAASPGQWEGYSYQTTLAILWCEAAGLPLQASTGAAEALIEGAERSNRRLMQLQLNAGLALLHWRRNAPDGAIDYLLEACRLAEACEAPQLLADFPVREALEELAAHGLERKALSDSQQAQLKRYALPSRESRTNAILQHAAIGLTGKERNILALVAQGKSNKEMARLLGITPETVKSYMKNIFAKLGVNNRAQAAAAAMANGLI